jgi:Holliday junction resolvase RusA-like endonuclease
MDSTERTREEIRIELELPPYLLHPNARSGWAARHRVRQKYRKDCGELAFFACQSRPRLKSCDIRLVYQFGPPKKGGTRHQHDPDNLIAWAKTAIDSLQDAGILADDRLVRYLPPEQRQADEAMLLVEVIG